MVLVKELIEQLEKADPCATVYVIGKDESPVNTDDGTNINQTFEIKNSVNCDGFYIQTEI